MNWSFLRLSLRARLYVVCATLILILLAPSYYTLRQLIQLRDIAFDLRTEHAVALQQVGELGKQLSDLNLFVGEYVAGGDPEARGQAMAALDLARLYAVRLASGTYAGAAVETRARIDSVSADIFVLDSLVSAPLPAAAAAAFTDTRFLFGRAHRSLASLADEIDLRSNEATLRAETIGNRTARTTAA
ncbi:MAG: hypothetical protein OEU54_16130, partial [Gemmatimonadota bacterium]|nr:hypothetical protein [Gemmatimonadota bacterium]